jgi:hypothetical protein
VPIFGILRYAAAEPSVTAQEGYGQDDRHQRICRISGGGV